MHIVIGRGSCGTSDGLRSLASIAHPSRASRFPCNEAQRTRILCVHLDLRFGLMPTVDENATNLLAVFSAQQAEAESAVLDYLASRPVGTTSYLGCP